MNTISIAVKKAADPSIKEETLVTLLFSVKICPIYIAITVPISPYGPPMATPSRKRQR